MGVAESTRDGHPKFRACLKRALRGEGIELQDADLSSDPKTAMIWVGILYEDQPNYRLNPVTVSGALAR
jgi:hypothetical protein